jgi:hypothetical protein
MPHGLTAAFVALVGWCSVVSIKALTSIVLTAAVIIVPGTKGPSSIQESPELIDAIIRQELQGWIYAQASDGYVVSDYPRSMGIVTGLQDPRFDRSVRFGAANMLMTFTDYQDYEIIGLGYSQGASVITRWLNENGNGKNPDAPSAEKLSFILIGNPNRPNGGLLARMPGAYVPILGVTFNGATPESQYTVKDVVRQYDLFGDFPIDPLNVFSLLNVLADAGAIHGDYTNVNMDDPRNWTQQHGNTTYVMDYSDNLPLLKPVYEIAASSGKTNTPVIDAAEPILRYLVELGYDRTSQSKPMTFQPGSSVVRLVQTLPEFGQAIKQGADTLQEPIQLPKIRQEVASVRSSRATIKRDSESLPVGTAQPPRRTMSVPTSASIKSVRSERIAARHSAPALTNR